MCENREDRMVIDPLPGVSGRRLSVVVCLLTLMLLAFTCLAGCGEKPPAPGRATGGITAGELEAPNALAGPGPTSLNWSPNGAELAYVEPRDERDVLWLYEVSDGARRVLLDPADHADDIDVNSAQWSPQGDAMVLAGKQSLWVLGVDSGELKPLAEGGGDKTAATFSPSGTHVSFVQNNDLYTARVSDGEVRRLTSDGSETVYNGGLDWVYTEELATRAAQPAHAWSPDGKQLIYLRLDDGQVQEHPATDYRPVPPAVSYTRYPTAGSPNPRASVHVITPDGSLEARAVTMPEGTEYVLPFFTWTPDSQEATYITVNRDQTVLKLNAFNPSSGAGRTIIEEADPHWINEDNYAAPMFLGDGQRFLWLSERDGFMHLYLYSRQGELVEQLTRGAWLIDTTAYDIITPGKPVHVDPSGTWAYFSATRNGPLERQIYRLNIESGELERVSEKAGFHSVALSGDGRYLADQFSRVETPPVTTVSKADGSEISVLAECAGPSLALPKLTREFLTVKAKDGTELNAQIVKPEGFDEKMKYGVVIHWYGGPGLQLVQDRYSTTSLFQCLERDVLYTQEGFIVWRLDNRGGFGRGHAFETPIDGELGPVALEDQLAGVEYLKSLPYVDPDRIGCDGHSFGGFLTLYALINEPEVFRCGKAGSPPTSWRYYDTIYTERYMGTPEQNPEGYAATDVISGAGDVKVEPMIIHGLDDTNVHLQNSVNFIQALEEAAKPFEFVPLPNQDHDYEGNGMVTALSASAGYFALHLGSR